LNGCNSLLFSLVVEFLWFHFGMKLPTMRFIMALFGTMFAC